MTTTALISSNRISPIVSLLKKMNGDIRNELIHSQGGIFQKPPPIKYYNPVAVHLKKIDYSGFCECRIEAWSEQFHTTLLLTIIITFLGTFLLMYLWADRIFERKKALENEDNK